MEQQTENFENQQIHQGITSYEGDKIDNKYQMIITGKVPKVKEIIHNDTFMISDKCTQIDPLDNKKRNKVLEQLIDKLIKSDDQTQYPIINHFQRPEVSFKKEIYQIFNLFKH